MIVSVVAMIMSLARRELILLEKWLFLNHAQQPLVLDLVTNIPNVRNQVFQEALINIARFPWAELTKDSRAALLAALAKRFARFQLIKWRTLG